MNPAQGDCGCTSFDGRFSLFALLLFAARRRR